MEVKLNKFSLGYYDFNDEYISKGGNPRIKKMSLTEQAHKIKQIAEESGVQSNFFFLTTFERYQVQLNILNELEKVMKDEGMLVSKEYVRGRKNLYSNPAVAEYNKTTDSANKTVSTLLRIIKDFNVEESTEEEDLLMKMINGSDEE
jgi:hypothetical protein